MFWWHYKWRKKHFLVGRWGGRSRTQNSTFPKSEGKVFGTPETGSRAHELESLRNRNIIGVCMGILSDHYLGLKNSVKDTSESYLVSLFSCFLSIFGHFRAILTSQFWSVFRVRGQDFFRGAHNSPNGPVPPLPTHPPPPPCAQR